MQTADFIYNFGYEKQQLIWRNLTECKRRVDSIECVLDDSKRFKYHIRVIDIIRDIMTARDVTFRVVTGHFSPDDYHLQNGFRCYPNHLAQNVAVVNVTTSSAVLVGNVLPQSSGRPTFFLRIIDISVQIKSWRLQIIS